VRVTADTEQALNLGSLIAESGRIDMSGALVRQSGLISANSASVGANGEIRLVAIKDLTLDAGSSTTANGPAGGSVLLQAQGGTNLIYGSVEATGSSGVGGTIQALGVRVGVIGTGVIDASGDTGGGTVLVGGDAHGANPNVQNAEQTLIGPDGVIRADASTTGDGGRVIVWSDSETRAFGSISAQGGAQSGNGGFVETSSAGGMDVTGLRVDTRAPNGAWGTWLLDPDNVIFEPNGYGAGDPLAYAESFATNPGTTAHITAATVEAAFGTNGTVQVQATNDVNFRTDLNLSYGTPQLIGFEVRAVNNIDMAYGGTGTHTIFTNGHNVTLSANDVGPYGAAGIPALNTASGTGSIIGGGNIIASYGGGIGGNITLSGYGVNVGTLQTAGGLNTRLQSLTGNVTISALGGGVQTGSITTRGIDGKDFLTGPVTAPGAGGYGGVIAISVAYGLALTGNIDASGGRGGNGGLGNGQIYAGASGGSGGNITIGGLLLGNLTVNPASITSGSITSAGGAGGYGGSGGNATFTATFAAIGYGGDGGGGGIVNLTGGNVSTGAITLAGGAGGAGGNNIIATISGTSSLGTVQGSIDVGYGGGGGFGGSLTIAGNSVSTGAITSTGGVGGAGGTGGTATGIVYAGATDTFASGQAFLGRGSQGGGGGFVSITGTGAITVAGAVNTTGSAGGAGGANGIATAAAYGLAYAQFAFADAHAGLGGAGGGSGQVNIQSTGNGNVSTGAITVSGAAGGAGGSGASASTYASSFYASSFANPTATAGLGGNGGFAGGVILYGGNISVGAMTATGGAGGAGGAGSIVNVAGYGGTFTPSAETGTPGAVGFGGFADLTGFNGVAAGSIDTSGEGTPGVTIYATTGDITTDSITARGGGIIFIQTDTGRIVVNGSIDTRGFDGGRIVCSDGCFVDYGGSAGGSVVMLRTGASDPAGSSAIRVNGSIFASGGNGFSPQDAAGGNGGAGGGVLISSQNVGFYGSVNVAGVIDVHAGNGGYGAIGYGGGSGGIGGFVEIFGASVSSGAINAAGGAGGAGGADSGIAGAGGGGNGGAGSSVILFAPGNIAVGNIIASGGVGGKGGKGNGVLAGVGGSGGNGGSVDVSSSGGSIDMTTGGTISAAGGNGGAGGAGDPVVGGNGGNGGYGGFVDILSYGGISVASALNIDGVSIPAGSTSISQSLANGGTGGAGGADFGLGAGTPGLNGAPGSFAVDGNIGIGIVVEHLLEVSREVNTTTDQLKKLLNPSEANAGDPKKDKDGDKKGLAVCK
jgi:hypothetical protein